MKKKMKAGFTLAETLITVVLIGVVFLAVGGGIIVFQRAYDDVTARANAQTMVSTAVNEMTADLKGASSASIKNDGTVSSFFTTYRGYGIQYVNSDTNGITAKPSESGMKDLPILTEQMNSCGLVTFIENFRYDLTKNVFRFKINVVKAKDISSSGGTYTIDANAIRYIEQEIVVRPNNIFTPSIVR